MFVMRFLHSDSLTFELLLRYRIFGDVSYHAQLAHIKSFDRVTSCIRRARFGSINFVNEQQFDAFFNSAYEQLFHSGTL